MVRRRAWYCRVQSGNREFPLRGVAPCAAVCLGAGRVRSAVHRRAQPLCRQRRVPPDLRERLRAWLRHARQHRQGGGEGAPARARDRRLLAAAHPRDDARAEARDAHPRAHPAGALAQRAAHGAAAGRSAVGPASTYGAWTSARRSRRRPTASTRCCCPRPRVAHEHGHQPRRRATRLVRRPGHQQRRRRSDLGSGARHGDGLVQVHPRRPDRARRSQRRKGYNKLRPAPVYCSGHVQLADGRVLIAGGNLEGTNGGYGLKISFLFDPWTETWVRQPDMVKARWYPTLTRMPDGRVAILAGRDEAGINRPEVEFSPPMASGSRASTPRRRRPPHHREDLAPAHELLPACVRDAQRQASIVGPTQADQGILDTSSWTWTNTDRFRQCGQRLRVPRSWSPTRPPARGGSSPTVALSTRGNLQPLVTPSAPASMPAGPTSPD